MAVVSEMEALLCEELVEAKHLHSYFFAMHKEGDF
jgi:hypothetical protein